MMLTRGLFRLWIVTTVLWIGFVAVGAVVTMPTEPNGPPNLSQPTLYERAVERAVVMAVLPPAFVLALGASLIWAFRGFRKTT
jgi:hypothetical protein